MYICTYVRLRACSSREKHDAAEKAAADAEKAAARRQRTGREASACVCVCVCVDACMCVGEWEQTRGRTGVAPNMLTRVLTRTTHTCMYSQMLKRRCRPCQCIPTAPWPAPSIAMVSRLPPPPLSSPLVMGESARAGLCVRVWTHTRDVVLVMHWSCPFQCQPTHTYTNRCITSSASIETETLQLKATRGGDDLSCSTDINKDAVCAQQGALTRIAVKSSAYNRQCWRIERHIHPNWGRARWSDGGWYSSWNGWREYGTVGKTTVL